MLPEQDTQYLAENLLHDALPGSTVQISAITADKQLRSRLCALGLTPGSEVHICPDCSCNGAKKIRIHDTSLLLDARLTQAIHCHCLQCNKKSS